MAKICALLIVAAGCGAATSPDITGIYQASQHDEDMTGCGVGVPVGDMPIFRLERVLLIDEPAYKYELCTAPKESSCLDLGILSLRFTVPTQGGWADDTYSGVVQQNGSGCTLTDEVSIATVQEDGRLKLEFDKHSMTTASPPGGTCDSKAARMAGMMPCVSRELMVAARVR